MTSAMAASMLNRLLAGVTMVTCYGGCRESPPADSVPAVSAVPAVEVAITRPPDIVAAIKAATKYPVSRADVADQPGDSWEIKALPMHITIFDRTNDQALYVMFM